MKKRWVPFVLLITVVGLVTVSCVNMRTLFDSGSGIINKIKEDALERERVMEKHLFVQEAVIFGLNKATLSLRAKELLNRKIAWLLTNPGVKVIVEGHCDSLGNDTYNLVLGEKRGHTVKVFMLDRGVDESRMKLISFGETEPVDCGKTEESLVKNRRVVLRIDS